MGGRNSSHESDGAADGSDFLKRDQTTDMFILKLWKQPETTNEGIEDNILDLLSERTT